MKKRVSILILALTLILGITGCGKKPASKTLKDSETEPVSSIELESSLSEASQKSVSYESDNSTNESTVNETTQTYAESRLPSSADSSTQNSSNSEQHNNTHPDNISFTTNDKTSPYVDSTTSAPKNTKEHTADKKTTSESRTTCSKTVPPTTTATKPAATTTADIPSTPPEKNNQINVTVSISCMAAINNPELKPGISLPSDGILLNSVSVKINKGDTVYDAFKKACSDSGIKYEFTGTEARKSIYISSISGLSQMDCGQYSGWKYSVNGIEASVGCSMYVPSAGDIIDWHYTTTL